MSTYESNPILEVAQQLRDDLAGVQLTPALARLYSHRTRLAYLQPGLASWDAAETRDRLHDAMRLTAAALAERQQGIEGWQQSLRRAGEILEWLSVPEMNPQQLPFILLASAAYQLAGYPARATGLLNQATLPDNTSQIIHGFLRADFRTVFGQLFPIWAQNENLTEPLPWHDEQQLSDKLNGWLLSEIASALGVICAFLRWGDEGRLHQAVQKLSAVADVFLNSRDSYSWLVAKLLSNVAEIYAQTALRTSLSEINTSQDAVAQSAIEMYLRLAYSSSKALTWPSQLAGIRQLRTPDSFALCTPTGSGKTTVAEIAILQSLFKGINNLEQTDFFPEEALKPLVIYLVPSRALAAEVEYKLHHVLANLIDEPVRVTGLYGGIEWGPTDVWLTTNDRTVLICTYEKAEALLKFVGPFFLHRISLIIIDEAHQVQYYGDSNALVPDDNRQLRLESLTARLLSHIDQSSCRVVALSAVSIGYENTISDWITGRAGSDAIHTSYRSTRQLIGRLEHTRDGHTTIYYDLLDGSQLRFRSGHRTDTPYIPDPFPPCPIPPRWHTLGTEKRVRPYLFWAALHLASFGHETASSGVLVAIAQQPSGYAEDLLTLLERDWEEIRIPRYFEAPSDDRKYRLWQDCLAGCEDYFTRNSCEYELLEKGIVLHHGKMPGILARALLELINEQVVRLVLATSTLSEGVNLPFSTILIPVLHRGQNPIGLGEFRNLVGRAGRPGFGTEGRTLVVMSNQNEYGRSRVRTRYSEIITAMSEDSNDQAVGHENSARSALASLLSQIERLWQTVSRSTSHEDFVMWLEQISPTEMNNSPSVDQEESNLISSVDTLDGLLLSSIVEIELFSQQQPDVGVLEETLQRVWRRTYAHVAAQDTASLQNLFVRRGIALRTNVYPDAVYRRKLYKTSLPPRSATQLMSIYTALLPHLRSGSEYIGWLRQDKFEFIRTIVETIGAVHQFRIEARVGNAPWADVLRWWLDPQVAPTRPNRRQISNWHKFVADNFQYRFNWGVGSIVALALDDVYQGAMRLPDLDEWPQTGLPWIVFWLKELIVWGTLDPVAAVLLSRRIWKTRQEAEGAAQEYYRTRVNLELDSLLEPATVNQWVQETYGNRPREDEQGQTWPHRISVELTRDFSNATQHRFRVLPLQKDDSLFWYDSAGFLLATSAIFNNWQEGLAHQYDFFLEPLASHITSQLYLWP